MDRFSDASNQELAKENDALREVIAHRDSSIKLAHGGVASFALLALLLFGLTIYSFGLVDAQQCLLDDKEEQLNRVERDAIKQFGRWYDEHEETKQLKDENAKLIKMAKHYKSKYMLSMIYGKDHKTELSVQELTRLLKKYDEEAEK